MSLKPITLWSHPGGPNPWKVAILLNELSIPFENQILDSRNGEMKRKPYTDINPNGRAPAIDDPNTGITLWESGAIIEYLIGTYDKDKRKLSYEPGTEQDWKCKQWLMFQMSGQGLTRIPEPYWGQAVFFTSHSAADVGPSARQRYIDEIDRTMGVLDGVLQTKYPDFASSSSSPSQQLRLVGDKLTYADLAFVTWNSCLDYVFSRPGEKETQMKDLLATYPAFVAWNEGMQKRDSFQKVWLGMRGKIMAEMAAAQQKKQEENSDAHK